MRMVIEGKKRKMLPAGYVRLVKPFVSHGETFRIVKVLYTWENGGGTMMRACHVMRRDGTFYGDPRGGPLTVDFSPRWFPKPVASTTAHPSTTL